MCRNCASTFAPLLLWCALLSGCASTRGGEEAASAVDGVAGTADPVPAQALERFEQAVEHMNAGDHVAAEQLLRAIADAYPAYSGALLNLGILQTRAGRLDEAEQSLRGAVERNANNAVAHNQLGIVYRRLGRFGAAGESYRRATDVDPGYATAWFNLGVLCDLYLQQPECALEALERYQALAAAPEQKVSAWLNELRRRAGAQSDVGAGAQSEAGTE